MVCLAITVSLFTGSMLIAFLTGAEWQRLVMLHPTLIDDGGPTELYPPLDSETAVAWVEQ